MQVILLAAFFLNLVSANLCGSLNQVNSDDCTIAVRGEFQGKEYAVIKKKVTHAQAIAECQNLENEGFPKGRLTTLGIDQQRFIEYTLLPQVNDGRDFWTGYAKLAGSSSYYEFEYGPVVEGGGPDTVPGNVWDASEPEPTGAVRGINCLLSTGIDSVTTTGGVYVYGPLQTRNCNDRYNFVCERTLYGEVRAEYGGKEFVAVRQHATHSEAIEYCSNLNDFPGGRLATVRYFEQQFLESDLLPLLKDSKKYWTGYAKLEKNTPFEPESYASVVDGGLDFVETDLWDYENGSSEPLPTGAVDGINCVLSTKIECDCTFGGDFCFCDGPFQTRSCDETYNFLCERDLTRSEEDEPKQGRAVYNGKEFAAVDKAVTHEQAIKECENLENFPGGRLTTISMKDQQFLEKNLINQVLGRQIFWTGYAKLERKSKFTEDSYGGVVEGGKTNVDSDLWDGHPLGADEPLPTGGRSGLNCLVSTDIDCYYTMMGDLLYCDGPLQTRGCDAEYSFICERDLVRSGDNSPEDVPEENNIDEKQKMKTQEVVMFVFATFVVFSAFLIIRKTLTWTKEEQQEGEVTHYTL